MNLDYLMDTELVTKVNTDGYLAGIAEHYPDIIDIFLKLQYFVGELDLVDTKFGQFQSFCFDSYIQAPYTFWVTFNLYQKGYYLEATILLRHSLEVFIQLKYFYKYPEKLKEHLIGRFINFSTMFKEFTSKEFYEVHYGHLLSSFAHGKLAKNIYRLEQNIDSRSIIMGCQFNPDHATYIINQTMPLLFGYLNLFSVFFPNNTLNQSGVHYTNYTESLDWLKLLMADHKKTFPKVLDWYEDIDSLIYDSSKI